MRCVSCQMSLLVGAAVIAGSIHLRVADPVQKRMIEKTLAAKGDGAAKPAEGVKSGTPVEGATEETDGTTRGDETASAPEVEPTTPEGVGDNAGPMEFGSWVDSLDEMISLDDAKRLFMESQLVTGDGSAMEVYFLDARSREDFDAEHVWGAYHISPESFFDGTLPEDVEFWQRSTPLVVYCTGGNCEASHLVRVRLTEQKFFERVYIMHEGFSAWKDAGLPVD